MRYEYIRIEFDIGDLSELNNYSMNGWRVVTIYRNPHYAKGSTIKNMDYALLERPIPGGYNISPAEISKVYGKNQ